MTCTHRNPEYWAWADVMDDRTGEVTSELVSRGGESTNVDLDVGRFRCTQCGEVGYYTGQWRRFFEDGVPCVGSDRVRFSK